MKNLEVRNYAKEKGVLLWEVADCIGMLDCNFSRKLRKELSEVDKKRVMNAIDTVAKQKRGE